MSMQDIMFEFLVPYGDSRTDWQIEAGKPWDKYPDNWVYRLFNILDELGYIA